ncbi:hypothetical protein Y1Q_0018288 [Alligator mississippiensis]|uniref:Uncharacterized protein n=1 Tax=Alligator mississippiensis TaxID=8496 RepID=A0A151PBR1_ALLMI|nr:hypothetical protein Y1Q_0018288 [Alligator mississippiensis]
MAKLVRAAKAQGLQLGPFALELCDNFVGVSSAYKQHKVCSASAFDVLVPLCRLPEPQGVGPSAFTCTMQGGVGWTWLDGVGTEELRGWGPVSSAWVLCWFQGHVAWCLGAVCYHL